MEIHRHLLNLLCVLPPQTYVIRVFHLSILSHSFYRNIPAPASSLPRTRMILPGRAAKLRGRRFQMTILRGSTRQCQHCRRKPPMTSPTWSRTLLPQQGNCSSLQHNHNHNHNRHHKRHQVPQHEWLGILQTRPDPPNALRTNLQR